MFRLRKTSIWIVVAVSAIIYFWMETGTNDPNINSDLVLPENPPDIYITQMDLTRYDSDGNVMLNTKADSLSIYETTGESHLVMPIVVLVKQGQDSWKVTAEKAIIYQNEDIEFMSNVVAEQLTSTPHLIANSEYMIVTDNGDLIKTHEPVNIVKGKQTINGIGMEVKIDTIKPIIYLLSEVSFFYDPL